MKKITLKLLRLPDKVKKQNNPVFDKNQEAHEVVVKSFIKTSWKMKIKDNLVFYRVHKIGRKGGTKLQPTVAKYVQHKDGETVRRVILGSKFDKPYGIKELSFPKDVVVWRLPLYPQYKAVHRRGKRDYFILEKLFLDSQLMIWRTTHSKANQFICS